MPNEIPYGEKTLKVSVYFWTNSIPEKENKQKTAWAKGFIVLAAKKSRGIVGDKIAFNNPGELIKKMDELLSRNNVKLVWEEKLPPVKLAERVKK